MYRNLVVPILVAAGLGILAAPVAADVIVVKKGRKNQVLGIRAPKGVEIDAQNFRAHLDKSTYIIAELRYSGLVVKKRARDKRGTFYPLSMVKDYAFGGRGLETPEDLEVGNDEMAIGNYPGAIGAFNAVIASDARNVFKHEASYKIGLCYYFAGNAKSCIAHWSKWPAQLNSHYTPIVFDALGQIQTLRKQYVRARGYYGKIASLPDITGNWKLKAKLGNVRVDIAQHKYGPAEQAAKGIAREASGPGVADARALALTLQAQAIFGSENKERLGEAQTLLQAAARIGGASRETRASLYSALGDVLYAQGLPEKARFPYMRVVCLYGDTGFVANALLNAGNCMLDMSGHLAATDQAASDALLVSGMKLLAECAGRHKGTDPGRQAARRYRDNKAAYEEAKQRLGIEGAAKSTADKGAEE